MSYYLFKITPSTDQPEWRSVYEIWDHKEDILEISSYYGDLLDDTAFCAEFETIEEARAGICVLLGIPAEQLSQHELDPVLVPGPCATVAGGAVERYSAYRMDYRWHYAELWYEDEAPLGICPELDGSMTDEQVEALAVDIRLDLLQRKVVLSADLVDVLKRDRALVRQNKVYQMGNTPTFVQPLGGAEILPHHTPCHDAEPHEVELAQIADMCFDGSEYYCLANRVHTNPPASLERPLRDYYLILTKPIRTNFTRNVITNGWAGTTNGISESAYGVYDDIAEAEAAICELLDIPADQLSRHALPDDDSSSDADCVRRYSAVRTDLQYWDPAEWLHGEPPEGMSAETTDEELAEMVAELTAQAARDRVDFTGDLEDCLREMREELREDVVF